VTSASVPVLWLFGPSGVGKTTVGREICTRLGDSGVRCALIDTDMIGLCLPSNDDDPEHHNLKARNLGALWPAFQDAGAQCLILTGGVEDPDQVERYVEGLPDAEVTVCQLTLSEADHRARIAERKGRSVAWADDLIAEGDELNDVDFADVRVDTGGLSVAESATQILLSAGGWPGVA
jgi:molybdopterin-guanine dinucleotide biosynthesis protein